MKNSRNSMRALWIVAMTALMPLTAGCSDSVTSGPAATAAVVAEATPSMTMTSEPAAAPTNDTAGNPSSPTHSAAEANTGRGEWVEYVRNGLVSGTVGGQTDDELVASAKKMCDKMRSGELFEEVAIELAAGGLPKPYLSDMQLILGTGTVAFCPEFRPESGSDNASILRRLRTVASTIAENPDSEILAQARTACPPVSAGRAGAAATVQEARRAWGHDQGYKFIFVAVLSYCPSHLDKVVANK